MNTRYRIAAITTLFGLTVSTLFAQGTRPAPAGERVPSVDRACSSVRAPLFRLLDRDRDGVVSKAEVDQLAQTIRATDKNGDGSISRVELQQGLGQLAKKPREGQSQRGLDRLFRRDKDGDGKLAGDELPDRMKENLERLDKNGDNAIDRQELLARRGEKGKRQGKRQQESHRAGDQREPRHRSGGRGGWNKEPASNEDGLDVS